MRDIQKLRELALQWFYLLGKWKIEMAKVELTGRSFCGSFQISS